MSYQGLIFACSLCLVFVSSSYAAEQSKNSREQLTADLFIGASYDQFSGPIEDYLNYESSESKWRFSGGVIFEYGLVQFSKKHSIWLTGKTLRGVRTAEVDCSGESPPAICGQALSNVAEQTKYLLRNASSFEAGIALRYEYALPSWNQGYDSAIYLKGELAGAAVDGDDDDMADMHTLSTGFILTESNYRGSFIELGYGKNEIFDEHPDGRLKIKARLVLNKETNIFSALSVNKLGYKIYVQTNIDSDNGDGADSVQTHVGFALSL